MTTPEDDATRARMDGDYEAPILDRPDELRPIPEWNPPDTSLPRKAEG